ncbi:MAG: glucose-1-phosphate thymidylyltransferase RfbA [Verrucomicrobiota bacterium]
MSVNPHRKGLILAGGDGTRLHPITHAISKQLLPIYDKPMIYYSLSVLMLAGIREILLISTPKNLPLYQELLGSGSQWGIEITYQRQSEPRGIPEAFILGENYLAHHPSCLILGDSFFYGTAFSDTLTRLAQPNTPPTILAYPVANPSQFGILELDHQHNIVSLQEKPTHPKSKLAIPGLYFFDSQAPTLAKSLHPSPRGELEITDLMNLYLETGSLKAEILGRGSTWLDMGSHDSLLDAANFVRVLQTRQGLHIACLEEIALQKNWITPAQCAQSVANMGQSTYRQYLESLLTE